MNDFFLLKDICHFEVISSEAMQAAWNTLNAGEKQNFCQCLCYKVSFTQAKLRVQDKSYTRLYSWVVSKNNKLLEHAVRFPIKTQNFY